MFKFLILIFLTMACGTESQNSDLKLINGQPATIAQVVRIININKGSACTATIVGTRVLLTAGHCASTGDRLRFRFANQTREAVATQSSTRGHDISLALVSGSLNVTPARIGGGVTVNQLVLLTGFGCTKPGGGGGNDGILRVGNSRVIGFSGFDFLTRRGSALCFGDSGGPAFQRGTLNVVGVNSRGNIRDLSILVRMDIATTRNFLKAFETSKGVDIQGL